jgi:hypothetical protein
LPPNRKLNAVTRERERLQQTKRPKTKRLICKLLGKKRNPSPSHSLAQKEREKERRREGGGGKGKSGGSLSSDIRRQLRETYYKSRGSLSEDIGRPL